MQALDLFVSGEIPTPLKGWHIDSGHKSSWVSPSGGYVDFWVSGDTLPETTLELKEIGRDPESIMMGCPVADQLTTYKMLLDSFDTKDLSDLLSLTRKIGIPSELEGQSLSDRQTKNLEIVKLWTKFRAKKI